MRAAELLGKIVVHHSGARVGYCTDLRCSIAQPVADVAPEVVLVGLLVSPHKVGSLLGYERGRTRGPWPLRALIARLHAGMVFIAWEDVEPVTGAAIHLRPGAGEHRLCADR